MIWYIGEFTCLKCGIIFEHKWTGGNLPAMKETAFAATNCPMCEHIYVRPINNFQKAS